MGLLTNKVAVITGASRGLGMEIARAYAREGASVVLGARSQNNIDTLVQELTAAGHKATGMVCDVADFDQVERLAELAEKTYGRIDIWVNNAGLSSPYGPTPDIDPQAFLATCKVNMFGTYNGSMAAMKRFRKQRSGKLINMLGAGSEKPAPKQNAYGSSKVWIRWFSTCLADETKGEGMEVLMLQPGLMFTDMINHVEAVEGWGEKVKVLETVSRILGNPPAFSAQKAVWLASAATDGKTGLSAKAPTTLGSLKGALRELLLRISGKKPAPRMTVREVPRYQ